ncbi:MAG: hypothetical protein RRZ93_00850, partial [Ruthenibacterium sp.]
NSGESAAQESARAAGVSDEKLRAMLAQAMGDFAAALLAQTEGGEPNA